MAIGENYSGSNESGANTTNSNKFNDPTYYSRVRFRNEDKLLSISYRAGLFILEMAQANATDFKSATLITIYLSPMKATMLTQEIKTFKEYLNGKDIEENVAFGVNAGMAEKVSYIGFHTNKDKDILVTIGKFDNDGQIVESYTFKFQKNYHYALEWKDISKMDIEKVYYDYAEFDMLANAIADFGRNMSGATAYAGLDLNRYEHGKAVRKFDAIYDKLGIERKSFGGNSYSNNNFLSNAGSSSKTTTIDEMTDLLE